MDSPAFLTGSEACPGKRFMIQLVTSDQIIANIFARSIGIPEPR